MFHDFRIVVRLLTAFNYLDFVFVLVIETKKKYLCPAALGYVGILHNDNQRIIFNYIKYYIL